MAKRRGFGWGVALLLMSCGGPGDVGDPCVNVGNRDDCVDGAICTNEAAADAGEPFYVCRTMCEAQAGCPEYYSCEGVSGTNLKSCQPAS